MTLYLSDHTRLLLKLRTEWVQMLLQSVYDSRPPICYTYIHSTKPSAPYLATVTPCGLTIESSLPCQCYTMWSNLELITLPVLHNVV